MARMSKPELLAVLAERTGQPKYRIERVLDAFAAVVTETIAGGDEVYYRPLGIFRGKVTPAREFKSEIHGQMVQQAAFVRIAHVPSAEMKAGVNRGRK